MSAAKQHLFTCQCHCIHELIEAVTACPGSAQDPHKIPAWVEGLMKFRTSWRAIGNWWLLVKGKTGIQSLSSIISELNGFFMSSWSWEEIMARDRGETGGERKVDSINMHEIHARNSQTKRWIKNSFTFYVIASIITYIMNINKGNIQKYLISWNWLIDFFKFCLALWFTEQKHQESLALK